MMLLVDCGNTRIKWAEASAGKLDTSSSEPHLQRADAAVRAMTDSLKSTPTRVIVSNVAGDEMARILTATFDAEPEFTRTRSRAHGVHCGYADPESLGVDRWLAMLAAHWDASGPVCVVSAGTAVTVDVVAVDGDHVGGLILVGARLAGALLDEHTQGIGATNIPGERPTGLALFGKTTDEAVGHGTRLATAAAIDHCVSLVTAEMGTVPKLVLTGGDAEGLMPWLDSEGQIKADLVLDGLLLVANESN